MADAALRHPVSYSFIATVLPQKRDVVKQALVAEMQNF